MMNSSNVALLTSFLVHEGSHTTGSIQIFLLFQLAIVLLGLLIALFHIFFFLLGLDDLLVKLVVVNEGCLGLVDVLLVFALFNWLSFEANIIEPLCCVCTVNNAFVFVIAY